MHKRTVLIVAALVCFVFAGFTPLAFAKSYLVLVSEPTFKYAQYKHNYNELAVNTAKYINKNYSGAKAAVKSVNLNQPDFIAPFMEQGYDLIITIGNDVCTLARNAAKENPAQKFAFIDFGEADLPPNACAYRFDGSEGAFLAGFLAARVSANQKLGFVGGLVFPQVQKMERAFAEGARYADSYVAIESVYVNDFFDIKGGKSDALSLYNNDADVIFHAAGLSGQGVIEAAAEADKWVIGVDADQYPLAPDNVLTSVMIDLNMAVKNVCDALESETFPEGKRIIMNLANNGVRLGNTKNVPAEVMTEITAVMQKIINGEIIINKAL